jgi:hypothetical protein
VKLDSDRSKAGDLFGDVSSQGDFTNVNIALSASVSKLRNRDVDIGECEHSSKLTGFRFTDLELLITFNLIGQLLCPQCKQPIGTNVKEDRCSLASKINFLCDCQNTVSFNTSKKKCGKTYAVNRRFSMAIFGIGRNYVHGKRFLGDMNIAGSIHLKSWSCHKKQIVQAT